MGRKMIRLSELLGFLMYSVDIIEFYNNNMTFLYSFPTDEIPAETEKISKFNLYENGEGKRILEVIEAK